MAAPVETAWRAWISATELSRWQADEVEEIDEDHYVLSWPALGARLEVEVVTREAERRLLLRSGRFEVEVAFGDDGLRFVHRGTRSEEEAEAIESSWRTSLALLAHYLEHHRGKPRSVLWLRRRVRLPAPAIHVFFSESAAIGSWLGHGSIGSAGAPYRLVHSPGQTLSGRVLANTSGRDVALSWDEQDNSVLVLRTLPGAGDERQLVVAWSRWGPMTDVSEVQNLLEAALDRLVHRLSRQTFA